MVSGLRRILVRSAAFAAFLLGAGAAQAQPAAADRIAVHYINVDQGNATLLEFPCGAILIDAGGRNGTSTGHLIGYLNAFFARRTDLGRRLDAVFLTHNHQDHDRALVLVAQTFRIGGYVHNGSARTDASAAADMLRHATGATPAIPVLAIDEAAVTAAGAGGVGGPIVDPLACPRVDPRIRVLSGGHNATTGQFRNPNNHSLVIRVDYDEASFLFTGDLELAGIASLLAGPSGASGLNVDVYEAGHHGADNATTGPLLARVSPEVAVISMGPPIQIGGGSAWKHGHPRRSTVILLEGVITRRRASPISVRLATGSETFGAARRLSDAIYGTGWDGDIVVSAGADGILQIETTP
jgi:competence protein ComEC